MRLLLVEDDKLLGEGIYAGLNQAGYAVDWVRDGEAAESAAMSEEYDCMVLDIGLPRQSGLEVLDHIRARGKDTPVLMLTARDTVPDRVAGLDHGADDYMIKPFDLDELQARIRSIMRRHSGRASPLLSCGDIELDPVAHCVKKAGAVVDLSPRCHPAYPAGKQGARDVADPSRRKPVFLEGRNRQQCRGGAYPPSA
jgi:DNA-binding response OmpR family regulator